MLKQNFIAATVPAQEPEQDEMHLEAVRDAVACLGVVAVVDEIVKGLKPTHWLSIRFGSYMRGVKNGTYSAEKHAAEVKEKQLRARMRKPSSLLWKDHKSYALYRHMNPDQFIKRVYRNRLGKGFTYTDLGYADKSLQLAYDRWRERGNTPTVDLPTMAEQNERDLIAAEKNGDVLTPRLWAAKRWREKGRDERNAGPRQRQRKKSSRLQNVIKRP